METKILVKISFAVCIIAVTASFITMMNFIGIMSGNGVGDWSTFFLITMVVGWIIFGLLNLNDDVKEFWKSI